MRPFYENLKNWRLFKGMTQEQLATRAGISRPNLAALERGRRECTLSTLCRLAFALDVTPGTLLDREPPGAGQEGLGRREIDRVARSLLTGEKALPSRLRAIREQAVVEAGPLLRAAGYGAKARIKKRIVRSDRKAARQVLERVSRLLPSFPSED